MTEQEAILLKIEALQESRNYADEVEYERYTAEIEQLLAKLED